ncbi:ankyrin [Gonapodya prolifera JEL478]|uniref:Ankyrin n=1 Tax=Gonapodya prolifera (strain JEL478) TaxID=1344416 RepID=A0A139ABI2_GONPJ|nr:ankyrin [Gonapodya prolifera JEL478]|eukprot:KXS14107.1 ankyrin [Gonapodya prolifera JEL478]
MTCMSGNVNVVRALLEAGADPNENDGWFLGEMVPACSVEVVRLLLDHGADIHAHNDEALVTACQCGISPDNVRLLLERGADVNIRGSGSALTTVSRNGHAEIARLLLDRGANVNANNDSALFEAFRYERWVLGLMLLDAGANPRSQSSNPVWRTAGHRPDVKQRLLASGVEFNSSTLAAAARYGHVATLRLLVEHPSVKAYDDDTKGQIWLNTCRANQFDVAEVLADAGFGTSHFPFRLLPPEIQGRISEFCHDCRLAFPLPALNRHLHSLFATPRSIALRALRHFSDYHRAIEEECSRDNTDLEVVASLLKFLAPPAKPSKLSLANAAFNGNCELLELLLGFGRVSQDDLNNTLFVASMAGHLSATKLLLHHGADPREGQYSGSMSTLGNACVGGYVDVARALLEAGADANENDGWFLGDMVAKGNVEVVRLLLDHGADVHAHGGEALLAACEGNTPDIVGLLLDRGADVTVGGTGLALTTASGNGHKETARLLLERGADVNANNDSALFDAFAREHWDLGLMLMDAGANPHSQTCDAFWRTAAHRLDVIRRLLACGVDFNSWALADTARYGHAETLRLLLEHPSVKKYDEDTKGLIWLNTCKANQFGAAEVLADEGWGGPRRIAERMLDDIRKSGQPPNPHF